MGPKWIQAVIRHFQNASDIAGLVLIEKQLSFGRVSVYAIFTLQHAQTHQSIQKVPGASRMESHTALERIQILGLLGQFSEELELDSGQAGFWMPKNPFRAA